MKRYLLLEDGSVFTGEGIGSNQFQSGEIVFTTGMSGYQETMTDNSYYGQIVMFTYPLIGNAGINRDDFESLNPSLFGLVLGEACETPSNFRCDSTLDEFMKLKNIAGIVGVDTRELTRKLRNQGVMKAVFTDEEAEIATLIETLKTKELVKNPVQYVSTSKAFPIPNRGDKIVLIDLGCKHGIIRELSERGCDIMVVPYNTSIKEIKALRADGIVISNGPGNPSDNLETIETIKQLIGTAPMLGISLGCDCLALALDAKISKMKFGHRGNSVPVKNLKTGKIKFTAQNHGYAIDEQTLVENDCTVTYRCVNDSSIEGFKHNPTNSWGIQFSCEAAPGADDCKYIFDEFTQCIQTERGNH